MLESPGRRQNHGHEILIPAHVTAEDLHERLNPGDRGLLDGDSSDRAHLDDRQTNFTGAKLLTERDRSSVFERTQERCSIHKDAPFLKTSR